MYVSYWFRQLYICILLSPLWFKNTHTNCNTYTYTYIQYYTVWKLIFQHQMHFFLDKTLVILHTWEISREKSFVVKQSENILCENFGVHNAMFLTSSFLFSISYNYFMLKLCSFHKITKIYLPQIKTFHIYTTFKLYT